MSLPAVGGTGWGRLAVFSSLVLVWRIIRLVGGCPALRMLLVLFVPEEEAVFRNKAARSW